MIDATLASQPFSQPELTLNDRDGTPTQSDARSGSTAKYEFGNGPGLPWSLRSSKRSPRYGFQPYADVWDGDLFGGSDKRHGGGAGAGNISEDKLSIIESLHSDRAAVEAQIRAAFAGMTLDKGMSLRQAQVADPRL